MPKLNLETCFQMDEIVCSCGCGAMPIDDAVIALQNLRQLCDFPFVINSGARCENHNRSIGGSEKSKHIDGIAFDIKCSESWKRGLILKYAHGCGFHGIGIAKDFVHLDLRDEIVCWVYA